MAKLVEGYGALHSAKGAAEAELAEAKAELTSVKAVLASTRENAAEQLALSLAEARMAAAAQLAEHAQRAESESAAAERRIASLETDLAAAVQAAQAASGKCDMADLNAARAAFEQAREQLASCEKERLRYETIAQHARAELDSARCALAETLSSLGVLAGEKKTLAEQLHELIYKYRVAQKAVEHAQHELEQVHKLMEHSVRQAEKRTQAAVAGAELRVSQMARDSRHERELLVQAALTSLKQLRCHLTTTLSGLRTIVTPNQDVALAMSAAMDDAAARAAKAAPKRDAAFRVDVVDEQGDLLASRFDPSQPPLRVRPLPPSPRESTSSRPQSASPRSGVHRSRGVKLAAPPTSGPSASTAAALAQLKNLQGLGGALPPALAAMQQLQQAPSRPAKLAKARAAAPPAGRSFESGYII